MINTKILPAVPKTIEGYKTDTQLSTSQQVKPGNLYGISKCFGEALRANYTK